MEKHAKADHQRRSDESTTTMSPAILLIVMREDDGGRDFQPDRVESARRQTTLPAWLRLRLGKEANMMVGRQV